MNYEHTIIYIGENLTIPIHSIPGVSTLSTGPVAFANGINYIDRERIMKCCRQDGLILQLSKPLTMIDLLINDWANY
ncbi:unnamed protein product [Rotaria socialis]|nr:unnamed protein product [Rotaria socialis]CAF3806613.1 unnamed protein product [Rotaria socialis]